MQFSLSVLSRLLIPRGAPKFAGVPLPHAGQATRRRTGLRAVARRVASLFCRRVTLGPRDTDRIIAHYTALCGEDRIARFHGAMTAQAIADRYRTLDWATSHVIAITFLGRPVALAEVGEFTGPGGPECEIAVSVLRDWQGLHLGERVMREAIRDVCGTRHLPAHAITQRNNIRFIRLARKLGAHGHIIGGEYDAVFDPV